MKRSDKTDNELLKEIARLKAEIAELKGSEIKHQQITENDLKESEDKFRILYESSRDAIMTLAPPSWKFTAGNQATIEMFNARDEEEFISKEPWELSPKYQPDGQLSSDKAKKMIEKAMQNSSNFFEWTHNRIKGENFPATVLLTRIELKGKQLLQATVRDISHRKGIEAELIKYQQQLEKLVDERTRELKENEVKFRAFTNQAIEGITVADLEGNYVFVNPAFCKMSGYSRDELLNMSVFDMASINQKHNIFIESKSGKQGIPLYAKLQRKDKTEYMTEIVGKVITIGNEKLILGTIRDITERQKGEEALRASEEQYRTLTNALPQYIYRLNKELMYVSANKTYCEAYGITQEEIVGKTSRDLFPEELAKRYMASDRKVIKTGKSQEYIEKSSNTSKGEKWVQVVKVPIRNSKDDIVGMTGIYWDITERIQTEEALKKSEEQYRLLFDFLPYGGEVLDTEGKILNCSPSTAKMLGYTMSELIGKHITMLLTSESVQVFKKKFPVIMSGKSVSGEIVMIRKDGTQRNILRAAEPIMGKNGKVESVLAINVDITDRKKAEQESLISQERLKMANKIVRHDLTNDLTVISSAVNIFKKTSDLSMFDEIKKKVKKSLKTIDDYKNYEYFINSKASLKEVELSSLIKKVAAGYPRIKFNVEGKSSVLADDALSSVFTNLISNSVKHGKSSQIDINIMAKKDVCRIQFRDNGTGIPDKIKGDIFEEGFAYGKKGNTGIGLHIVKTTIERYGGSITVRDNESRGVVFILELKKVLGNMT